MFAIQILNMQPDLVFKFVLFCKVLLFSLAVTSIMPAKCAVEGKRE